MANLSTTYLGMSLKNPLIVGSCGLTGDVKNIIGFEKQGAGAIVLKSLFEEEIIREMDANLKKMASAQFIFPETLDFYDKEPEDDKITTRYLELVEDCKKSTKLPIIASINCVSPGQWAYFPKRLEGAGADAIELNIFLLPAATDSAANRIEQSYFEIIKEVTAQVKVPVSVKISSYFTDLAAFVARLSETPVKGVVLFNRFYNPDIDIDSMQYLPSYVLSNPADITLPLRWVALLHGRVGADLAASGGVHDEKAFIKLLLAGAQAVQTTSMLYKNGPESIGRLLKELETWMDNKGYGSVDSFRGIMAYKGNSGAEAFERVQFMKYLKGYRPETSFSDDI